MVYIWIDELTPCLKDTVTGDLIPTEVTQIVRKSFLTKFREDNGLGRCCADQQPAAYRKCEV